MLNELKEDVEKDNKMMCEQNRNINKEIKSLKKPKRNSGVQKYNNLNKKFIRGIQRHI